MCLTLDHQSLEDDTLTLRWRDTMQQWRVPIDAVLAASWTADSFVQDLVAGHPSV